jgi:hypothetical protein
MSLKGWFRWMRNQLHAVGAQPPRPRRPAPAMQRNLHKLEALLEQGAGREPHRRPPLSRELPLPLVRPSVSQGLGAGAPSAWAAAVAASTIRPETDARQVPTQLVLIALDASNRPVRSYTGTAHLTSTEPAAARPGDYTFTAEDFGGHRFSVTLSATGSPPITVPDAAAAAHAGSATEVVGSRSECY